MVAPGSYEISLRGSGIGLLSDPFGLHFSKWHLRLPFDAGCEHTGHIPWDSFRGGNGIVEATQIELDPC